MKVKDIKVGVEYLVITPWIHTNRDSRNPETVTKNHGLFKVTLQDLTKYSVQKYYTADPVWVFPLAADGERTYGFLTNTEDGRRFVVKPADIVGEAAPIEARWAAEEAAKMAKAAQLAAEAEARQQRILTIKQTARRDIESIQQALLRERIIPVPVGDYHNQYRADAEGHIPEIVLPISVVARLVEKYLELKDQLED